MDLGICFGIFVVITMLVMVESFFKGRKHAEQKEKFRLFYQDIQRKYDAVAEKPPFKQIFCHNVDSKDFIYTRTYYLGYWKLNSENGARTTVIYKYVDGTYTFDTEHKVIVHLCKRCARNHDIALELVIKNCPDYDIIGDLSTVNEKERTKCLVSYVDRKEGPDRPNGLYVRRSKY